MKFKVTRQITFPNGDVFSGQTIELSERAAQPLVKAGALIAAQVPPAEPTKE